MQSFCQETEFSLTDDVHHNKLKKHHSSSNHRHNNNHGSSTTTTTAQGGLGGGGGGAPGSTSTAHNSSGSNTAGTSVTATHLQQQQDQLAQLLNSSSSNSSTLNCYGHAFSGASPTIPASQSSPSAPLLAKVIKGDSDRAMLSAEKRAHLAAKTPGRAKFNSIDNESLKESGGGGGGESRKVSSGVAPSKKLKKSSSSSGGGGGASSSSKHHHHSSSSSSSNNHHHHSKTSSSTHSSSGEKTGGGSDSMRSSTAAVLIYEKGVNIGYNLFAKLRDLYNELKAETSPRTQSMNLLSTSFLLDKLVSRESLHTLVLNLYPGNKGYSLAFRVLTGGAASSSSSSGGGVAGGGADASGIGGAGSSSSGGSSSRRDRLQSGGGAVPNTINSGSPSSSSSSHHHHHPHHSSVNHSINSPSSSSAASSNVAHPLLMTPSTTAASSLAAGGEGDLHETMRWPYEEEELLACIDNEELPLMFVDLFEKRCPQLFYSGCVIVEVRDYRQSFPISTACDKFHVLLRPTNQTLLADVHALTSEGEWSHEEKMALESQLILATAEPLCLDPSPQVGINSINGQHERRMFNSMPIRRHAKKFSQVAINRKRKTDQFTHHFGLELFDFMARHRQRPRLSMGSSCTGVTVGGGAGPTTPTTSMNSFAAVAAARLKRLEVQPVRAPSLNLPETLQAPSGEVNVERFAKAFDRPRETKDCMPQLVEEYVLETDRGNGRVNFIKLSILQRPSNSEYLGMLYLDRDYREDQRNGEACQFSLGTRAHANRYIQQFTEIFTEEGRKKVKITHVVPGQQPRVTCTTGLWEQQQQLQQAQQGGQQQLQPVTQQQQQQQPLAPPPPAPERTTPQLQQMQSPAIVQQVVTPTGGATPTAAGGIITVGGVTGMEAGGAMVQNAVATLGPQGQLVLSKAPQFSFQVHQTPASAAASTTNVVGGNIGVNKLVVQQQQGQQQQLQKGGGGAPTMTLTNSVPVQMVPQQTPPQPQQQQQQLTQGQATQLLANSQIKLVSTGIGPTHQFIQFSTTAVPQQQQQQQTIDAQGIIGSNVVGTSVQQQQQQQLHQLTHHGGVAAGGGGPGQPQQPPQQQPIQYAAIMNCDNTLLKNAISSGSQLGIRNGSLVLLQQNQAGKTSAVSLVQTTTGTVTTAGGNGTTTQMHVSLPQGLSQGVVGGGGASGRQILQSGGVPVLQAQLVGVPITQQSPGQNQPQQQQVQATAAAVVMSPPPAQLPPQQPQPPPVMQGTAVGGIVQHQQPHHSMVQQTQSQLTTKQQNIHATNPAINALFTSLLASANQFEQQQAAAAAAAAAANNSTPPIGNALPMVASPVAGASPAAGAGTGTRATTPTGKLLSSSSSSNNSNNSATASNSTIINLLNSAPAAMTNKLGCSGSSTQSPATPGPPQLVNAFSGLVSPPPSSAASSSSQYGNSPATPITGGTTSAQMVVTSLSDLEMQQHTQQQLSKPLTKQQMTRLLNGGTESPALSSPSPSEGSGTEQQQQPHGHQSSVRVTMSALASQLASPPAIMTNSIIQTSKHLVAQQQQQQQQHQQHQAVKVNLSGPSGPITGVTAQQVYGLNGMHQGATIMQQRRTSSTPTPPPSVMPQGTSMVVTSSGGGGNRREILNIMSPGSDSNHSTASSFSLSMPTLNNLLAGGGGGNNVGMTTREVIGGPASVGASSNGGSSMPPSPANVQLVTATGTNKVTTASGNILTIHASPGGGGVVPGSLIGNNSVQSNSSGGMSNSVALSTNSLLIDRLTAMANSGGGGTVAVVTSSSHVGGTVVSSSNAVPTSILQLQAQSPFLQQSAGNPSQQQQFTIPAASPKANANIQLQSSPVVSGSVSPQAGQSGAAATTTLNLQGLNLASLQGAMATIPGLQNVQVQIPGLAHTISLSLSNNPNAGGGGPSGGVSQQIQATAGGQQTVVLTNSGGGGQTLPFAQLVTSATGLKGLTQQNHQKQHLVATSLASGMAGSQGTPIQLVGLQMNPATRNITATVSSAANNQTQMATILSVAGSKMPGHRLACPQLVRTVSSGGAGTTTLKLTGGVQVQGGTATTTTTQGIFVNQSSGMNPILMTPQQLQALQKQKQQQQQQQLNQQMQSGASVVPGGGGAQIPTASIVAKATTKHGK